MKKTIYISGPITDLSTGQPREGWQQEFRAAETKLRRMGFQVINPVDIAKEVEAEWLQMWSLQGDMDRWNGPIADALRENGPTRATYIVACLQKMNDESLAGRLHGVYIIGRHENVLASHGVRMEAMMAEVLGLPIYAKCLAGLHTNPSLLSIRSSESIEKLLEK